jgi:hypothetical protein
MQGRDHSENLGIVGRIILKRNLGGIISNTFKPNKVQKGTRINLYTSLALPVLLYGSETWTGKSKDKSRLTAAKMRFMRKTAKYTWRDHKTN